MAAITPERWFVDASALAGLLARTARRRAVDDPHVSPYLSSTAALAPAPALFRSLDRQSASFSQWWTRVTRGLRLAEELL
jgi:deoxyribodipyrimidine photo-lyase